ncbi:MAG TPA: lipopolysaccharide biosynthesis protein [Coleofasciculaceae cyanobacterium]
MAKSTKNKLPDLNRQFFCTDHLKTELKQRSVRGGAVTLVAQAIKFILRMGSTVVLARLLSPEDYGLIGMATVVIGFVQLFKDLGLSAATVQKSEINHQQVSTLFWINLIISLAIALLVIALAPLVARFYDEPLLRGITMALAITFIFGGLTVQHQALLQRQMRFLELAKIEIVSMLVGVIVAVASAWYGLGYWALVLMQIATVITNAIAVWLSCSWRPGFASQDSAIRSMLAFGGNLTGFRLVNYFSRNLDNLLIGRYWGSQQLGLYAKAYQLVLLPIEQINSPVNSVALPTLSSLQSEPEKYSKYYYKAILLITTLGMPIVGFMFASADKVILLMLGEQWLGVVPIFQYLMPAAFIGTFNVAAGWVYQSLGRTDRQFRIGMVMATTDILLFSLGLRWGAVGVAAFYGLSRPILMIITIVYCYRGTFLKVADFFRTIFRPVFASVSAAIALIGVNYFLVANLNFLIALLIDLCLYFCFYLSIWIFIPGGKSEIREILHLLKTLKPKRK